jgi:hypothetical protein
MTDLPARGRHQRQAQPARGGAPPRSAHTAGCRRRPARTPGQHAGPVGGAVGGQLGHQASLAHTGLAPHEDDGRLAVRRPYQGRLKDTKLLDTADKGRAHHAAAHLARIIPHDRSEGNGRRTGSATKIGSGRAPTYGTCRIRSRRPSAILSRPATTRPRHVAGEAGWARGRGGHPMNNQHAGLSQVLAEQRITERRRQAAHARLVGGARPQRRRRRWAARGWWQLARRPSIAADQPVHHPHSAS